MSSMVIPNNTGAAWSPDDRQKEYVRVPTAPRFTPDRGVQGRPFKPYVWRAIRQVSEVRVSRNG